MDKLLKNGLEIERRFLVLEMPNLEEYKHSNIVQYYLNDKVTRLRKIDDKYILTQKSGSGLSRTEIEYEINKDHFDKLKLGAQTYVMKTRYYIPLLENLVAELDIFEKKLAGIVICEVEFASIELAEKFEKPLWLGKEITFERNLSNKAMSKNSKKAIELFNKLSTNN